MLKSRIGVTKSNFVVPCTRRGLVVTRLCVLRKQSLWLDQNQDLFHMQIFFGWGTKFMYTPLGVAGAREGGGYKIPFVGGTSRNATLPPPLKAYIILLAVETVPGAIPQPSEDLHLRATTALSRSSSFISPTRIGTKGGEQRKAPHSTILWGRFQWPLTLILLQKYQDTNGAISWCNLVVHMLLSAKRRAEYFCQSIAIETGGV